mgnify:CR=1 FL=1
MHCALLLNRLLPNGHRGLLATLLGFVALAGFAPAAQAQIGGAAVVFLMIEPDSRSAGMGNTGVAIADNANAIFWNPAGLAYQTGSEAALTHSNWLPEFDAGLFYEYLVAKHHIEGWGTLGAHVTYLFLGDHEYRDAQNNPLGEFKSYDLASGASYGFHLGEHIALGTGLRLIYSSLARGVTVGAQETNPGVSAGVDVAGLFRTSPMNLGGTDMTYSFGFNLANMGPKIQYSDQGQADPIPTNLRFGYAATFEFDEYNKLTLLTDLNKMLVHRSDSATADPFYKAIFSAWSPMEACPGPVSDCEKDPSKITSLNAFEQMTLGAGMESFSGDQL